MGDSRSSPQLVSFGLALRDQLARLTRRCEHETALPSPSPRWISLLIAADLASLVGRNGTAALWPWPAPPAARAILGP
jgi:hypothetical protein